MIGMRGEDYGNSFLEIETRAKISVFLASKLEKNVGYSWYSEL